MMHIELSGDVGLEFTYASVAAQLRLADGPVRVTLNSGGGIASEGAAIYSALASYAGGVDIEIVGIAASAASLIAMAGRTIEMAQGAVMMIHDPNIVTVGNSADHAKSIEELETFARSYAKIYALRCGKTEAAARTLMRAETWFDGPEAVAAGFATATTDKRAKPFAKHNYADYRKAEQAFAAADPTRASWKQVLMKMDNVGGDNVVHWVR